MNKISVIITTYNGSKTIEKTLNSIYNQEGLTTHFTLEVFVIDDQSTDQTRTIVQKFPVNLIVNEKNSGGPNKGRNVGLKRVTGDFICIVDQDDEWLPNRVLALLPYLNKSLIVTSGFIIKDAIAGNDKVVINNNSSGFVCFEKNSTFLHRLEKSSTGQNTYLGSIIYSASLKHIEFEEDYGMVDFDWSLKFFHQQSSIEVCQALYVRNLDGKNLSMNETYRKNDYDYSLKTIENYKKNYPIQSKRAIKKVNGTMARYYYSTGNMKQARIYLVKSSSNLKTILYFLTTFIGSGFVIKKFSVFGN